MIHDAAAIPEAGVHMTNVRRNVKNRIKLTIPDKRRKRENTRNRKQKKHKSWDLGPIRQKSKAHSSLWQCLGQRAIPQMFRLKAAKTTQDTKKRQPNGETKISARGRFGHQRMQDPLCATGRRVWTTKKQGVQDVWCESIDARVRVRGGREVREVRRCDMRLGSWRCSLLASP